MDINSKREEIKGFTSRDLVNINDNFRTLWQGIFGNINFTDGKKSADGRFKKVNSSVDGLGQSIGGLGQSIGGLEENIINIGEQVKEHVVSYHFDGEYSSLKNPPKNIEMKFKGLSILRQNKIGIIQGRLNPTADFTGSTVLFTLEADYRPSVARDIVLYCSNTKTYTGFINTNGDITMNSRTDTIKATDIIIFNNSYII